MNTKTIIFIVLIFTNTIAKSESIDWFIGGNTAHVCMTMVKDTLSDSLKIVFYIENISDNKQILLHGSSVNIHTYIRTTSVLTNYLSTGFGIINNPKNFDLSEFIQIIKIDPGTKIKFETKNIFMPFDEFNLDFGMDFAVIDVDPSKKEKRLIIIDSTEFLVDKNYYLEKAMILNMVLTMEI